MDTSQYLSMFLEESIDNLQALNESLLQLEQEPEDIDKLNEIFRVAHTIKGMAATMGFNKMAELTHKMEDVLSKFREGDLKVTQKVVTVLFQCLDALEHMVNNISDNVETEIDIRNLIEELEKISERNIENVIKSKDVEGVDEGSAVIAERIELNEYEANIIRQAHYGGYNAYEIKILLSENTLLKSARAFLVFQSLEENGEIIKSIPGTEDLENENFEHQIEVVYLSLRNEEEIQECIINISEIDSVHVNRICLGNEKSVQIAENMSGILSGEKNEISNKGNNHEDKDNKVESSRKAGNKSAQKKQMDNEAAAQKKTHQSVRVDLERLDKFMNMVSELVIHRTRLEQISTTYKLNELNETLEQVARTTSDLQDLVMKIRMLPLDIVFNRFPRMIRDLSVELGKEIEFVIQGADTELDRTVIDEIGEPLIHIIRNAADHGIEKREERTAKGKEPAGTIKLTAYQEGTKAVIKVEDDGRGISVDKVKAKAEKLGINTEGMSDNDIINLIFLQGFSTSDAVTDISGRGVGMDVVKTKIAALGGTVDVISEIDKGSCFIIKLPLTLQIIQALLVKIGNETMAISLGYIDRVIDFKEEMIKRTSGREVIIYRGNVIPLIRVSRKLGLEVSDSGKKFVVIVRIGERTAGLMVDALLGQQEIVIKPLGKTLKGLSEYIGATILGDGLVTLILDAAAVI